MNQDNLTGESQETDVALLTRMLTYLSDPLWMLCQEQLQCMKLLWYALDVIQSVDTNNNLDAIESLLKLSNARIHGVLFQILQFSLDEET